MVSPMHVSNPCIVIASVVVVVLLNCRNVASSSDVIDLGPSADESIVDLLCDQSVGHTRRISRISTIAKLHGYLEPAITRIASCRLRHLKPLADLKGILETGSEDVCSYELMEQIDKFHWNYIVGELSTKWRTESHKTIPEPLRMFFMNYVQEVTERCKGSLLARLTSAEGKTDAISDYDNKLGRIINGMKDVLRPRDAIKKHDDFLLILDQLIDRERRNGRSIEQKVDPATGEKILVSFKIKHPEQVWSIQRKCRQELRPVYKQTVLPVMRFISLGYGNLAKQTQDDVAGSELVRSWYAMTQLCQLILPVNFYPDESLGSEQITVMNIEETNHLPAPDKSFVAGEIPMASVGIESIQLGDIIPNASSDQILKRVKSNLKVRNLIDRKVFKNIIKIANGQLRSKLKNLFITRKLGDNKYVVENGETTIKQQLEAEANELLLDEDGPENGSLVRNKRGTFKKIMTSIGKTIVTIVVIFAAIFVFIAFIGLMIGAG